MKKTFATTLLFVTSFLFINCESESLSPSQINVPLQSDYIVNEISFSDFTKNKIAFDELKLARQQKNPSFLKNVYNDDFGVFIDTTHIVRIDKNGNHSYTFKIVNDAAALEHKFENLILNSNTNGTYKAYITKYTLSQAEIALIQNGETLPSLYPSSIEELYGASNVGVDGPCMTSTTETEFICHPFNGGPPVSYGNSYSGGCNGEMEYKVTQLIDIDINCLSSGGDGNGSFGPNMPGNPGSNPSNPIDSNPGGGVNPSNPNPVITTPILLFAEKQFVNQLSAEQKEWWNNPTNAEPKQDIVNYLQQNQTEETEEFVKNVIDEIKNNIVSNNAWPDNVELFNYTGPEIIDITEYLKCFDITQQATFTIYADQPTPNDNDSWAGNVTDPDVGHTFISIKQGNIRRVIGFYPADPVNPFTNPSSPSQLVNNSGHSYDAMISITITPSKLQRVINYIKNHPTTYNLNSYNCTDFGMSVSKLAGLTIPSAHGSWPGGSGDNPGQLGQNLRNIPLPANSTRSTNSSTAASNMGTCN